MTKKNIKSPSAKIRGKSAEEIVSWALENFGRDGVALATSFGAEDQILTDMLAKADPHARIFTLDTGRLPSETLETLAATRKLYSINIEIVRPDPIAVEKMVTEYGENLFYESAEKRKLCCRVRKVDPLAKKLENFEAWICGLRKEQSDGRWRVQKIEWDENFGLFKINPLADWSVGDVWDYIKKNNVPYNKLHDRGYPSIGCAPCTRAVKPGEDFRAGRWWWETTGSAKECGLHQGGSSTEKTKRSD